MARYWFVVRCSCLLDLSYLLRDQKSEVGLDIYIVGSIVYLVVFSLVTGCSTMLYLFIVDTLYSLKHC